MGAQTIQSTTPLTLTTTVHPADYQALGFPFPTTPLISVMADTGCQSWLTSLQVIQRLGLTKHNLIPVTMHMYAANNNNIKILGAVILRLTGPSRSGKTLETRQIVYVTTDSNKFFLSREACTELGLITTTFPTVGEAVDELRTSNPFMKTPNSVLHNPTDNPCNCPRRQLPPPKPTQPPFPATPANRQRGFSTIMVPDSIPAPTNH